jgi:regulator of replication initiation timing
MKTHSANILKLNYDLTSKALSQLKKAQKKAHSNKAALRKMFQREMHEIKKHYGQQRNFRL